MPLNLLKKYPELLEIGHLAEPDRNISLKAVFKRDIEDNPDLRFRTKVIRPIKGEEPAMQLLFRHLTTEEIEETDSDGKTYKRRIFEIHRSQRIHWVKFHFEERLKDVISVFSTEERINGRNAFRTYIYDHKQKYVIVMEPQRSGKDYYLLSAYFLNRSYGEKMMQKKMKSKLPQLL
ncbi:MAG: hypothetical protein K0M50_19260 [Prolixibacteraceae bacterium]|jgi:hypothetical protein|nr:hypothetical protein [Prolixibacteraceae bacterium]